MSKAKLLQAIQAVNKRYKNGLNNDDQVRKMIDIDLKTIGNTFMPLYDTYELCTDYERLFQLCKKYGYWSNEVKTFNERLSIKGGFNYMQELNNKYLSENKKRDEKHRCINRNKVQ